MWEREKGISTCQKKKRNWIVAIELPKLED